MMKKTILLSVLSVVLLSFTGCSMMPDDEEIVRWSIMENEIFDDEEWNEIINNEELKMDNEEWEEQNIAEDEEIMEDEDEWDSEIQFDVVK